MGNFESEPNVISIMIQKQAYVLAFRQTRPTLETNRVHQAYAYASPGLRQYWSRHCLQLHPYNYGNFKKAKFCCSLSSSSSLPPVSLFLCLCLFLHPPSFPPSSPPSSPLSHIASCLQEVARLEPTFLYPQTQGCLVKSEIPGP